jgi:hypothetical protein
MNIILLLLTFFFFCSDICIQAGAAVTYQLNGGRLGDHMLTYMHAKWISYTYSIPLLYKPFIFSDQLLLHELEKPYTQDIEKEFKHVVILAKDQQLFVHKDRPILYIIPYFPECLQEYETPLHNYPYFAVDWEDLGFKAALQQFVKPRYTLQLIQPPKDHISVAVHVRKNSNGFDLPLSHDLVQGILTPGVERYVDVVFPLKHVPDSFYIEQIKKISEIFNHQPLYVFIFSDDVHVVEITKRYQEAVNLPNIEFACRITANDHATNILEDFFSMALFDCLIRADSNISIAACKLGNYRVLITPKHHRWDNGHHIIDEVNIVIK